jgi:hypothetical protein
VSKCAKPTRANEPPRESYGLPRVNSGYRWDSAEERFDASSKLNRPRESWRLQLLREWSQEQVEQVFP